MHVLHFIQQMACKATRVLIIEWFKLQGPLFTFPLLKPYLPFLY